MRARVGKAKLDAITLVVQGEAKNACRSPAAWPGVQRRRQLVRVLPRASR